MVCLELRSWASFLEHTWVHFACHDRLDLKLFDSSFKLSDAGLTLLDIARAELPNAEFVFLSACHAAELPVDGGQDEVLHLAAAMQICGFAEASLVLCGSCSTSMALLLRNKSMHA